jgi:hypothetical protein
MCEQPDQRGFSTDKRTVGTIGCRVFDALADKLGLKQHSKLIFWPAKICLKPLDAHDSNFASYKDIDR